MTPSSGVPGPPACPRPERMGLQPDRPPILRRNPATTPSAPPAGQRATGPADRICGPAGATVLTRNTLRKDNAYFSWDVRISRPFAVGARSQVEVLVEIFNLTGNDNFRDPSYGNLVFNFDGTIRSGLGDPRQVQAGVRWLF